MAKAGAVGHGQWRGRDMTYVCMTMLLPSPYVRRDARTSSLRSGLLRTPLRALRENPSLALPVLPPRQPELLLTCPATQLFAALLPTASSPRPLAFRLVSVQGPLRSVMRRHQLLNHRRRC